MKAILLLSLALALSSCEHIKQFDYAVGTSGQGYFLTVAPKPPSGLTSAKQVTNVRP